MPINRRQFTKGALLGTIAAGLASHAGRSQVRAAEASAKKGRVRLGAPVFEKSNDPEVLALAHVKLGYTAAYCPPVKLEDTTRIADIHKAYSKHGIVIAEVGRWCNLLDADPEKRKANLKAVTEGLALAEEIGALCCVDIAGSYSTEDWFGPHPDNITQKFFDATVENARAIIDAVKPKRAKFCFEMMGWSLPDSADSYLELLRAVDRPAFGVHLDPCNLINSPRRFYRNTELLNECFDKLGPHIVSCHAKDLQWIVETNVHFKEVPPGAGKLDYKTFLTRLAALEHQPPLMIEHCAGPDEYDQARQFIQQLAPTLGVEI
ncbi:MAG TPA: TIM barrel protein [Phycisphaerae bacterium]|nr:TIM barrel protein [Phycisphaerae bacterium]